MRCLQEIVRNQGAVPITRPHFKGGLMFNNGAVKAQLSLLQPLCNFSLLLKMHKNKLSKHPQSNVDIWGSDFAPVNDANKKGKKATGLQGPCVSVTVMICLLNA